MGHSVHLDDKKKARFQCEQLTAEILDTKVRKRTQAKLLHLAIFGRKLCPTSGAVQRRVGGGSSCAAANTKRMKTIARETQPVCRTNDLIASTRKVRSTDFRATGAHANE